MSANQKNKETISALYENGFNKRDLTFFHDLISPEYIGAHGTKGAASFEGPIISLIRAMPDVQWKIQELLTEGEKVVARWKVQGTQTGIFNGFPPSSLSLWRDGFRISSRPSAAKKRRISEHALLDAKVPPHRTGIKFTVACAGFKRKKDSFAGGWLTKLAFIKWLSEC